MEYSNRRFRRHLTSIVDFDNPRRSGIFGRAKRVALYGVHSKMATMTSSSYSAGTVAACPDTIVNEPVQPVPQQPAAPYADVGQLTPSRSATDVVR